MTIKKENSKRILALVLTLALLLGALFTGAISATATSLADGLTDVATVDKDGGMYTTYKSVEDISGGGIKYTVANNNGAYSPYVHNVSYGAMGTGLRLQFANYTTTASGTDADYRGYRQFLITFATGTGSNQGDNYRLVEGAAGLIVDTNEGKLLFVKGKNAGLSEHEVLQTLATDEALLYDNFTGNPFTVDFYDAGLGNGDVTVKLTVDGTEVTGTISNTKIAQCTKWPTGNGYVAISSVDCNNPGAHNPMTIEYYGFKAITAPTPAFAEGLTAYATTANNANTGYPSWPGIISNINGGGIRLTMFQWATYQPYVYNVNLGGYQNNFKLQFANYRDPSSAETAGHGHFLVSLNVSNASDDYYKFKTNCIGIDVDTVNGKVDLIQSKNAQMNDYTVLQNIITDDDFKYANFTGKPFSYTFSEDESGTGILLTVDVGGEIHTGVITYANMAKIADDGVSARAATATACYISIGGVNNVEKSMCYVDFYGYKAGVDPNAFVISKSLVDDLTATVAASDDLMDAAGYRTITDIEGGGVNIKFTNYSAYGPYGYKNNLGAWPSDGFKLQFGDYRNYNTDTSTLGNGVMAILLAGQTANDRFKLKAGVPFLRLDTVNGTLKLAHGDNEQITAFVEDETIITNDALKAANLKSKAFSISIVPKTDGNYTVIFEVDGTEYTGTMTHSLLFAQTYHPTSQTTYVSISGLDNNANANNSWSVNFYGYKKLKAVEPDCSKDLTTVATKEKDLYPVDGNNKTVTDIETGGVKISYQRTGSYYPYIMNESVGVWPANGYRIQFAKYSNDNTNHSVKGDGLVAIMLSGQKENDKAKMKTNVPFLLLNTNDGTLSLAHGINEGMTAYDIDETIITNNGLKAAALKGKAFSISIVPKTSGTDYDITVDVEGTKYTGTMTDSLLMAQTYHPNNKVVYVGVGGTDNDGNNYNYWSINFYGVEALKEGGQEQGSQEEGGQEQGGQEQGGQEQQSASLTDGLTTLVTKDGDFSVSDTTRTVTNIEGGGIKYEMSATKSGGEPYTYNASLGSWPAYGYRFQFNNYVIDSNSKSYAFGYGEICIGLTGQTANGKHRVAEEVPFIDIDTKNGKLKLCKGILDGKYLDVEDISVIATNDIFKYENITGKPFSVTVKPDGTDLVIEADVAGTKVSGLVAMTDFTGVTYAPTATATYVSVGSYNDDSGEKYGFSLEFYGIEALAAPEDPGSDEDPTPATDLTEGLTGVAKLENQYQPYTADATAFEFADIEGGGVKLKYRKCSSYFPYRLDTNMGGWPSGGFTFQFFNYKNNNGDATPKGNGLFAIALASQLNNDRTKLKTGVPFFLWDTNTGALKLAHATAETMQAYDIDETIITNDGLKAAALAGKPFSLTVKRNKPNYDITVNVDGTEYTGTMTGALFENPAYHPNANATYMSIGGLDNDGNNINKWQIDYYGFIKYEAEPGQEDDPGQGGEEEIIPSERTEDLTEIAVLSKEYEPMASDAYTSANIEGGGVKLTYKKCSGYFPYRFNSNIGPWCTPFMLRFANYKNISNNQNNDSDGQFAIVLSGQQANDKSKTKAGVPFLMVDTNEGTMRLMLGLSDGMNDHESQYVIMRNDALKKANIEGKEFTITVYKATSGAENVSVEYKCGDTTVYGEFPESLLSACTYHPNANVTYVSVGGTDNNGNKENEWSIEFYGYKVLEEVPTPPEEWEKPKQDAGAGGETNEFTAQVDFIATVKTEADRQTTNYRKVTDIEGGGVNIDFINNSAYMPYRFKYNLGAFPGSGIELWCNHYVNKNDSIDHNTIKGDGQIMFLITDSTGNDRNKPKTNVPFIVLDTNKGTLELWHGTAESTSEYAVDEVILTDEALKYSNITGKFFKLIIKNDKDSDNYTVSVELDDVLHTGIMHAEKLNAIEHHPGSSSTYISIGGPESNDANGARKGFSIDFYGCKRSDAILPDYALDLSEYASTATNANTDVRAWWSTTDYSCGGVHFNCFQLAGYEPYVYTQNVGGFATGFKLVFANYNDTSAVDSAGHGQFLLILAPNIGSDGFYKFKTNVVGININTVDGKVELVQSDDQGMQHYQVMQEIIVNDMFKYENFTKKGFTYEFKALPKEEGKDGNDIKLIMTVGDKTDEGVIKYDNFSKLLTPLRPDENATSRIPGLNTTYISFGGITNQSPCFCDVDFYGYKNYAIRSEDIVLRGTADEVNGLIANLPATATEDNAAQILTAKAKYDALSAADKRKVNGVETLDNIYAELDALRKANKMKPRSTYLALNPTDVTTTVANPFGNPGARTVFSNETDDGFHVQWKGAGYVISQSMRVLRSQAIQGVYPLDGLRVIVENYDFAAGAADFLFHFTSGEYSDLWNGKQKIADREIAIRMGTTNRRVELAACAQLNPWYAGATDFLTKDNLKGKTITIEWHKVGTDYICYISVKNDVVAITMSAQELAKIPNFDPEHVSVIIGTENEKNAFSMDVTGISAKFDPASLAMMEKIDNLPATVSTQQDVDAVNSVYEEFLKLTVPQSINVLNKKELNEKRYAVQALAGTDEQRRDANGYTIVNTIEDMAGDVSKNSKYSWAEDIITENGKAGVHLDYNNGGYGLSNFFQRYYVTDGISLRFNNFNFAEDSALIVGIENCSQDGKIFDHNWDTVYDGIYLLIGQNNTIYSTYSVPGRNGIWIQLFDQNEHLSEQNLLNKEFYVSYKEDTNPETGVKTLYMTFTVDGIDFTYHFDEAYMKTMTYFDSEEVQVVVHCPCGYDPGKGYNNLSWDEYQAQNQYPNICSSMSIDITGFKFNEFSGNQQRAIDEVIELIDALPDKATYDIEETINEIMDQYFHLGLKTMRLAVTNYQKLLGLKDQLFDMHLSDGTMYPVEDEETEEEEYLDEEDYDEYEYDDDDYYDYDDYDDEDDYDDDWYEEEEFDDEDDGSSKGAKKVVKRRLVSPAEDGIPAWLIIVIAAALVLIAGAAAVIIILAKRKKQNN